MARQQKYAVQVSWRVQDQASQQVGTLIEWLRYAGVVIIITEDECANASQDQAEGRDKWIVFHINQPAEMNGRVWAEQNARRIQSFGVNAVPVRQLP